MAVPRFVSRAAAMGAAAVLAGTTVIGIAAEPAAGHGGPGEPVRPAAVAVEPAVDGLSATAVHTGSWQLRVENRTSADLSVLDGTGRSFLRIGPGGVRADFAAAAWYVSNSSEPGVRVPPAATVPEAAPDWRAVAVEPVWSFFDARLRVDPSELPGDVRPSTGAFRVKTFSIPIVHGDRPGAITGGLDYEPVVGTYRHRLVSPDTPADGVSAGLVGGLAVPAVRLENRSAVPVTVMGGAGEPFARIGPDGVAVNVHSPTWVTVLQSRGQTPFDVADASAEPNWQRVFGDPRWSWPEFRGRPPDAEPPPHVVAGGGEALVSRWDVPIDVDGRRLSLRGTTSFVPLAAGEAGGWRVPPVAVPAVAVVTLAAATVLLPRRRQVGRPA